MLLSMAESLTPSPGAHEFVCRINQTKRSFDTKDAHASFADSLLPHWRPPRQQASGSLRRRETLKRSPEVRRLLRLQRIYIPPSKGRV